MKYIEERIVKILMIGAIGIVGFFVLSVLYTIFRRGLPVLSWEMVSQLPSGGFYLGGKGGFLNAIVGSLYIVGGSTLLGLIISLPVVFEVRIRRPSGLRYALRNSEHRLWFLRLYIDGMVGNQGFAGRRYPCYHPSHRSDTDPFDG